VQTESQWRKNEEAESFRGKIARETDAWDLRAMIRERSDVVVIDARRQKVCIRRAITGNRFRHATMKPGIDEDSR